MSLRMAKVVAVHPQRRTVDLVFLDNAQRVANVQVMTPDASTDSGSWSVPDVPRPRAEGTADTLDPTGRNLIAVCAFMGRRPIVQGFLHPARAQVAFKEQNRQVHRHPSGAYTTIAPDGSIEVVHPSGAYLRIGTGGHQDLGPLAADGNWVIPGGAAPAQVTLATAGFTLTILPNGSTTLATAGQLNLSYGNAVLTGDVKLNGSLVATGDVTAGTVSLKTHIHDVAGGKTTAPEPGPSAPAPSPSLG